MRSVEEAPPVRDPDGLLLEVGRALQLPPWLEPDRATIDRSLPDLKSPGPDDPVTFDTL